MIPLISNLSSSRRRQGYPVLSLFEEMNRLFDESAGLNPTREGSKVSFIPSFDIKETKTEYVLTGEFPGLTKDQINIELKDNVLTLSGEKKHESERREGERVYLERSYGSFFRSFPFDTEIDEDNANAEMKDGLLTITIPKSAKVIKGAKKLSIK
jgi:HSP20 family protein